MLSILQRLHEVGSSVWYWLGVIAFALALLGMALYYQYQLGFEPCVLCVHVRIWVIAMITAAVLTIMLPQNRWVYSGGHLLVAGTMVGMLERAWRLLATERGVDLGFGSCNFDAGLPDWFALDRWFPALFEVREACGETPELLFGITMAEALAVIAAAAILWSLLLTVVTFREEQ